MHPLIDKKVQKLVNELQQTFEDRLVSVCVYGSSVLLTGEAPLHGEDINITVILSDITHADLEKASAISKWWQQVGHCLPLFFSEGEWLRSADVFALEYADIRDNHVLAYGKDLFSQTTTDTNALRLVCELELHRKLIFLRQRMLILRDDPRTLTTLLTESMGTLTALFRGVCRLHPQPNGVPMQPAAVYDNLTSLVDGFDAAPFHRVLAAKGPQGKLPAHDAFSIYSQVVQQVGLVTAYVDQCFGFVHPKEGVSL